LFDKAEVNCTYNNVIPLGLLHGVMMTMTQATDQDIQEIKKSIDANSRAIDALAKGTEANTKAIADLTASVSGLREEMRVGFADLRGDIKVLDNRLGNLESTVQSTAQKLPDLAEKVGELKNYKQIAIVIFTASVSSAIAWFLRGGKF
jgi:chromosome segregation ATPase